MKKCHKYQTLLIKCVVHVTNLLYVYKTAARIDLDKLHQMLPQQHLVQFWQQFLCTRRIVVHVNATHKNVGDRVNVRTRTSHTIVLITYHN